MKDLKIRFWVALHRIFGQAENFCLSMAIRIKFNQVRTPNIRRR